MTGDSDTIRQLWDILYPGHPPLEALAPATDDTPDRVVTREVECLATITDEDGNEATCPFAGVADVAVFDDTEEALWVCPDGHENSIPWWEL